MKKPLVSIIMPAYNAEKFIREAVDSILNQTFDDFELIILNDGSTDSTRETIESYADDRIVLINKENEGVARTLNAGLKMVQGRYIWRHDADDTCLSHKLKDQVEFLEAHKDIVLCGTQIAFMTERGRIAMNKRQPKNEWMKDEKFRIIRFEDFSPFSPITHATVLFRTNVLDSISEGYRTAFKTAEDVDLWLRMMEIGNLAVMNDCNYFVRLNKASATAVHGWKNEFYREQAKAYYLIRKNGAQDELQRTGRIIEPPEPIVKPAMSRAGRRYRGDLLSFQYAVAIDALDWIEYLRIIRLALRDGGLLAQTYRSLILPILPAWALKAAVGIKRFIIPTQQNG